jgi:hypothetical protein
MVNKKQIPELVEIIMRRVAVGDIQDLIRELKSAQAYKSNKSYRQTVDIIEAETLKRLNV